MSQLLRIDASISIAGSVTRALTARAASVWRAAQVLLGLALAPSDGAHVYWTNGGGVPDHLTAQSIGRADLDGGGVNQNFIGVPGFTFRAGVAVDAAHIYWTNLAAGTIGRANRDGTGVNPSFVEGGDLTFGVAVDSAHLYWTNQFPSPDGSDGGTIGRANLDGTGVTQTFITGLGDPQGVAVDASTQAEQPARISLDDVTMTEGDAGQTAFRFTASLGAPQPAPVTVDFATGDGTATAPSDYAANNGTVSFAPGDTTEPVTVRVNGDTTVESNETFNLNLANAAGNATIADGQAVATIVNDDQAATDQPPGIPLDTFGAETLVTSSLRPKGSRPAAP